MALTNDTARAAVPSPGGTVARRLSSLLSRHGWLRLTGLLSAPLAWLVAIYVVALAALLVTALWQVDSFTGNLDRSSLSFDNIETILTDDLYRTVTLRTVSVAALVTLIDVVIALPIAFYMAKLAKPRVQSLLVVAVLLPLWSSYLVKVGAWRLMLSEDGAINWALSPLGLHGPGFGTTAVWLVMSYIWLPYMIIPIYAGLERIPDSLLSASEDLGAKPGRTFRKVIMPLTFPAIVAGSIFTFSLTLGDYITPANVGDKQFIGNVVYSNFVANLPLAAAITTIPIVVMVIYLLIARRLGAFEHV